MTTFWYKYISPHWAPSVCHLPLLCFLSKIDNPERPFSYWPFPSISTIQEMSCSLSSVLRNNIIVKHWISAALSLPVLKQRWATQSTPSIGVSRRGFGLGLGGWAREMRQSTWPYHGDLRPRQQEAVGGGSTAKPQLLERESQDLLFHNVWKSVRMYVMMMIKWYMVSAKIVSTDAD